MTKTHTHTSSKLTPSEQGRLSEKTKVRLENPDDLIESIEMMTDLISSYLIDGTSCSEFELIRWLQNPDRGVFREDAMSDTLTLFRSHFLVMHCLHRLRIQWLNDNKGYLEISALNIHLTQSHERNGRSLAEHDPLANYYLDLSELATEEETIDALLNDFWRRMVIPERLDDDLRILELQPPADSTTIRQQYRRLAMQHHPDKGGDPERFQLISAAYQRLKHG